MIPVVDRSPRESNSAAAETYRPEIDGLRAIAVLVVVLFHLGFGWFSGGFVGVDVFLVISGYLITSILTTEMDRGEFSFSAFYKRRVLRIVPALALLLAVSTVAAILTLLPNELVNYGRSLRWTFFARTYFSTGHPTTLME
jgi:peptidoglycan/LPS O-acetylase OafA/YrhL